MIKMKKKSLNIIKLKNYRILLLLIIVLLAPIPQYSMNANKNFKYNDNVNNLEFYLNYAAKNNPGLKAAFKRWKAELEKVTQVQSLPDPKFNFAYFISEVETKVGPQQMKVGFMQKFPWFGKLKLRGEKVFERAQALKENFERVKLELFYKVKKLYYDYYFVSKSIEIIRESITLLEVVNEQIGSMYSTGIASYSNLIRIQVELDKLKDKMKSLEDKRPSIGVALNAVMNRPFKKKIYVEKDIKNIEFQLNSSILNWFLRKHNPELKILDHFALSIKAGVKLARKNYLPDISIGADVIVTGDSSMPGVLDSGKDPFLIKMSMNIPLRFKKINASIKEAKMRLEVVNYEKIEKENRLTSILESSLFKFNDSGRIVKLYRDSLIPKAKQAFEVTKTAFSTGRAGFLDFIDTQRTLLDFELILEKAKSSHLQTLAFLEKIIGKKLNNLNKEINFIQEKK